MTRWIIYLQWFFLIYMLCISMSYFLLNIISLVSIARHMVARRLDTFLNSFSDFEPPVSILVPAYNEAATIESTVLSLLQLAYSEFEVIVINDGSKDQTLQLLIDRFQLLPIPAAYQIRLPVEPVRGFYKSTLYPNLRVIDKDNGGKADALNAGINATRYPLFCSVDADSILQRDSLKRVMQPFLEDPQTVAAGGTIRIVNGSEVRDGFLLRAGLPKSLLVRMQIIEYLRAFLFGRLGWSPLNSMLIISGAFGVFRKEVVVQVGGYHTDTVGEDMELVVRLHRSLRSQGKKYRISFVPDPICWTEAPADLKSLNKQRTRSQVGLAESLSQNLSLLFNPRGGLVGWIAFPYMLIFELFGPVVEVAGYIFVLLGFALGIVSIQVVAVFFLLAVGLGMLVSVTSLLLEQISFHIYSSPRHMIALFLAALAENLGYRQLISLWRLLGLLKWMGGGQPRWGEMTRQATWQTKY